jgi:D-sedoheptulose 7-phosphate isomerase
VPTVQERRTTTALTIDLTTASVLETHLERVRDALQRIPITDVERVVDVIVGAYNTNRHIYVIGNGGSASTATHFACDLSKATIVAGRARMRVTSLTDNVALVTAWANDTSYERVFAEQLISLLDAGDVVLVVSASGNSPNLLAAVDAAHELGAVTVGVLGFSGGRLKSMVTTSIHVQVDDYGIVEGCHLVLEHAITEAVHRTLCD